MDYSFDENGVEFIDDGSVKETIQNFDKEEYNMKRGPTKKNEKEEEENKRPVADSPTEKLVNEIKNEFESFQNEIKFKDLEDAGTILFAYLS